MIRLRRSKRNRV